MKVKKQRRGGHKSHPRRNEHRRMFVQNESIQNVPSVTDHQNNALMQNELSKEHIQKQRKKPLSNLLSWLKPRRDNSSGNKSNLLDVEAGLESAVEAGLEPAVDKNEPLKYPFDFGSPHHYETADSTPHMAADIVAQRALYMATKFWAGFFASINIVVVFPLTFVLQLYR